MTIQRSSSWAINYSGPQVENFLPYLTGKKQLTPRARDLTFCNWATNKVDGCAFVDLVNRFMVQKDDIRSMSHIYMVEEEQTLQLMVGDWLIGAL